MSLHWAYYANPCIDDRYFRTQPWKLKAGKFTIKESKITNFNNRHMHVVKYTHHNLRVSSVNHFCHVCTISLTDPREGKASYSGHPRNDTLGRKILNLPQPNQPSFLCPLHYKIIIYIYFNYLPF